MGKFYCDVEKKWCKLLRKGVCKVANTQLENLNRCPRIAAIETTTLYDLIRMVNFEDVFARIIHYFHDQEKSKDGYQSAFGELLTKKQDKHRLNDLFISVELENEEGHDYLYMHGINKNTNITYGIEFCPWSEWVTMFIDQKTLDTLSKEDIVAGCLYEMTYFGFSEKKVRQTRNDMYKGIEEAKAERK